MLCDWLLGLTGCTYYCSLHHFIIVGNGHKVEPLPKDVMAIISLFRTLHRFHKLCVVEKRRGKSWGRWEERVERKREESREEKGRIEGGREKDRKERGERKKGNKGGRKVTY